MAITRIKLLHHLLLQSSCSFSLLSSSPSISLLHFHHNLSTLADADNPLANNTSNANTHYPNLFEEFATTKFNLSSADISRIVKSNPSLERLKTLKNVEQFVELWKRYGGTQQQIAFIMKKQPQFLTTCLEKVIEPKILFLRDLGIKDEDVVKVVASKPRILSGSLQHTLIPNAAFLQHIFKTPDLLTKAISRNPIILIYDLERHLKPSVAFFEECGLVGEQLSKFLMLRPALLCCNCLTPAKADFLQKIGIDKESKMYKYVLTIVLISHLETLEAKIDNFQQCGLTAQESLKLFSHYPLAFNFSVENVRQRMDFIVNDMELPANSVLTKLFLLQYSLKVVKPRFLVLKRIQTLNSLGHLDTIKRLKSILAMSDAEFVNKMIEGHPESKLLNEIYQEALIDASEKAEVDKKKKNIRRPWCF